MGVKGVSLLSDDVCSAELQPDIEQSKVLNRECFFIIPQHLIKNECGIADTVSANRDMDRHSEIPPQYMGTISLHSSREGQRLTRGQP